MDDYMQINREWWNEAAQVHAQGDACSFMPTTLYNVSTRADVYGRDRASPHRGHPYPDLPYNSVRGRPQRGEALPLP